MVFIFIGRGGRTPSQSDYKRTLNYRSNSTRITQAQTGLTSRPRYWPILTPTKCSCTCGLGHASEFWASWVHLYGIPRCIMVQKNSTSYKRAHHDGDVHANCQPKQYSWMTNDQLRRRLVPKQKKFWV